jgi:hypothetical protein
MFVGFLGCLDDSSISGDPPVTSLRNLSGSCDVPNVLLGRCESLCPLFTGKRQSRISQMMVNSSCQLLSVVPQNILH